MRMQCPFSCNVPRMADFFRGRFVSTLLTIALIAHPSRLYARLLVVDRYPGIDPMSSPEDQQRGMKVFRRDRGPNDPPTKALDPCFVRLSRPSR